ncbi:MAG: sensor histidine kinase [Solirubrobacteraceae bacterium]
MAATGSEPRAPGSAGRGVRSAFSRRLSLRSRLTLLYGTCFLLIVAAVLAGAYALVAHDIADQPQPLGLHTKAISRNDIFIGKAGVQLRIPLSVPLDRLIGPRYSAAQMAKARAGALAMTKCERAHGHYLAGIRFRALAVGHGLQYSIVGPTDLDPDSKTYNACFPLLNNSLPPAARTKPKGAVPEYQGIGLVVEWARGVFATQRSRSLHSVLVWLGVAFGVMVIISVLVAWLLAGRAVRPLRTMVSKARRITEESLHERLAPDVGEDEFGELATTFDDVLGRLERAFDAQKRFVANASHELRTPVTVERALLELTLANPDADTETLRRTCERVLNSAKQQQQIVEALLALARTQTDTTVEATVDLGNLTQAVIALREQQLDALTLATDLRPAPATGDPALLERLIANLLDNAIVHNVAEDGWITIETGTEGANSWLRVSNSGPEVPEAMTSEIFEPFRRIEGERAASATGLGLGLSIVQGIADLHDATIDAHPLDGGGLRVEVRF